MARTILTFGDSNTHGTPPIVTRGVYARYDADTRWPTLTARALDADLIEEGLPGRLARADSDPEMGAHMNGHLGLHIALNSHGPIDTLTLMLGTNDCKAHFGQTPAGIAAGIAGLLAIACGDAAQTRHGGFGILLICPPPIVETGPISQVFLGATNRSQALASLYRDLAATWGTGFLNAADHIAVSSQDGVHFDPDAHKTLAATIAIALRP
ncbi:GDSL-type esterase/lipase family protein [Loktanella sp. TSTF-M6]|uniref:GDSL-type esterase/lipase family protein n=1 Tax=Loktanella gaetbuli TaxID=2881335 RepID=A0ABS8BUA0_9RHOB|nr:GDSL-type esterase/lipase family protein [Loktanella gaetbuli]MCB5199314.1 GDSL-type esterase/lipase family protein [Loktanella gaetbuli]